ncbi:Hypothetical predicted protein, partial [Mytilus galloprovincialis]
MAVLLLSVFVLLVSTLTVHCATFANAVQKGTVTSHYIHEASGLCASRQHPNMLYTHNDSGDTHRIYAIDGSNGQRKALIWIDGAHSTDWEDIACGPCAGGSGNCVYIADTGGNAGGDANTIYRIREPDYLNGDMHVSIDSTLQFSWDQHDCETVMVDPNGEVYVVSKVSAGHHAKFVHLPKKFETVLAQPILYGECEDSSIQANYNITLPGTAVLPPKQIDKYPCESCE